MNQQGQNIICCIAYYQCTPIDWKLLRMYIHHLTAATCPESVFVHSPVSMFHTRNVASREPLTTAGRAKFINPLFTCAGMISVFGLCVCLPVTTNVAGEAIKQHLHNNFSVDMISQN